MKTTTDRITFTHVYFWGGEFSNFYLVKIKYNGINFYSTEQIFMWEKALYFNDKETAAKIMVESEPSTCKALGRQVKNFDANKWSEVSYDIMVNANYEKYTQSLMLKDILLATKNRVLVEASPYDKIWGVGLHQDDDRILDEKNWKGQNLLGKALMEVRDKIKNEL
ncbi:MAG: NADAR family protein [bacterium]